MKKAASIFLRACERRKDMDNLIYWLKNPEVTRFLNEDAGVISYLSRLADTVPEPMLTFHLNAMGRFFMICLEDGTSVGFVKLAKTADADTYEIVYAIGEDTLWGFGYGEAAIRQTLHLAFEELGIQKIIAKIDPRNERSRRLAFACGFREEQAQGKYMQYAASIAAT